MQIPDSRIITVNGVALLLHVDTGGAIVVSSVNYPHGANQTVFVDDSGVWCQGWNTSFDSCDDALQAACKSVYEHALFRERHPRKNKGNNAHAVCIEAVSNFTVSVP